MMKHYLCGVLALLLASLLMLSGCGRVTATLDQHFPEASETEDTRPLETPLPDRIGRTYVVLLTTQLSADDALSTVSLLTFQTADQSIHWLELPTALYVRSAGNTLGGSFNRAYQSELAKESGTAVSATNAAVNAVRNLLNTGFSISIDFSVNFDGEQFAAFLRMLQNVPVTLPTAMGGLKAGAHTLDASDAVEFLLYDRYNDPAEGQFEARRYFVAALRQQACKSLSLDQLSLIAMDLRGQMTTDIPSQGGQDMFFLRHFLKTENNRFTVTNISTQNVYSHGAEYRVLVKDNTRRQLNLQMQLYEEELTAEQFDPTGVFVDPSNQIMHTVYNSASVLPRVYSLTELLTVEVITDPETTPNTGEPSDTSDDPTTVPEPSETTDADADAA
ncbi:MAG: hypothetical protein IJW62_07610 [Clostridia bacterium]|nr:hypothetical protein [Clostridia bacterium]